MRNRLDLLEHGQVVGEPAPRIVVGELDRGDIAGHVHRDDLGEVGRAGRRAAVAQDRRDGAAYLAERDDRKPCHSPELDPLHAGETRQPFAQAGVLLQRQPDHRHEVRPQLRPLEAKSGY